MHPGRRHGERATTNASTGAQTSPVDEVGGLSRAIALARERGKLSKDAAIVQWPDDQNPFGRLSQLLGVRSSVEVLEQELAAHSPELQAVFKSTLLRALLTRDSRLVGADLVLQRQAVRRFVDGPAAGRLARRFELRMGRALPRTAFRPPPQVDSSVLVIRPLSNR